MIRIAINGYGNLAKGVEKAVLAAQDMELVVIFTRRDPASIKTLGTKVEHISKMQDYIDKVDVCVNCGGSATDLMEQGPATTLLFNTVDSFDTHAKIPQHFADVDEAAQKSNHTAVISSGWDPGLFSMMRVLGDSILPNSQAVTFWGPGVSQGHSDAIRRIKGVKDACQYTLPVEKTVQAFKNGEPVELSVRSMHTRDAWVVAEEGADLDRIEQEIKEMPNYFDEYETSVHFISEEELKRDHAGIPHGGQVIRRGQTSADVNHRLTFELALDSNPEFTGSVLCAVARACARKAKAGQVGAYTMLDLTLAEMNPHSAEELRAHYL